MEPLTTIEVSPFSQIFQQDQTPFFICLFIEADTYLNVVEMISEFALNNSFKNV